jgi:hypothetical protein
MASTTETNFMTFYNGCPSVIIRDKRGEIYSFPSNSYNNGNGGTVRGEEDSKSYANSRRFGNFRDGEPWSSTRMLSIGTYRDNAGGTVSDLVNDNAWDEDTVNTLNNGSTPTLLPGYTKISRGKWEDRNDDTSTNTKNYISANRGTGRYDFIFSVYTKKDEVAFLNDFLGLGDTTRNKFLTMASVNASFGNQRFGILAASHACNQTNLPSTATTNCNNGAAQWCRDDGKRLWGNDASTLITDPNTNSATCRPHVTSGALDDFIFDNCKGKSVIDGVFCKDIRKNSGSLNLKNRLDVALKDHCSGTGNDINTTLCTDVKTACSAPKAALDNTTVSNYQCKTLVNSLNDINKIAMLESTMNIFAAITAPKLEELEKSTLSTDFNGTTKAVQSALCSKAANASEASCKDFLSQNYKTLLNNTTSGVTDTKPVLIMYFNDSNPSNPSKLFAVPLNMVGHNSLNIPSWAPTEVTARWYAKLYTYITPSTINDYLFVLKADDDAKLFINNTLIIDAWGKTCCKDYDAQSYISLNPANGPYLLTVEYRDTGGAANMYVKYKLRTDNHQNQMPVYDFIVLPLIPGSTTIRAPVTGTVSGTNRLHTSMTADRLYMSKFHPYEIIENARRQQSLSYCQANNASGVPRFASDSNCLTNINNMYALSQNTKDDPYRTMINEYCRTNNRFATDTNFCDKDTYSSYILNTNNPNSDLNSSLGTYCGQIVNNLYPAGTTTNFCRVKDNQNTTNFKSTASPKPKTMNDTYAATIRNNRLAAMRAAIDTSLSLTDNGKGTVTQDVLDYIMTDYPAIQSAFGIANYANDRLIPHMLYAYCESLTGSTIATSTSGGTTTKTLTTSSNLCNAIYNTYKTDLNIIASLQRIEDNVYGIQNNAFMGVSGDDNLNTKYKRERDSPEKFARYLPYAVNYCAKDDNIVSEPCRTYYEGIEGNINAGFAKQYNNASVSGFANKEEFCNNNEYDNGCDNECNNSNSLIFFLLFLFVIILVISLGGVSKCRKPNYYTPYNDYSYY